MTQTGKASPLGILKRSSSASSRDGSPQRRASGVHFLPPPKLLDILQRYFSEGKRNMDELEGFITHMRNQNGQALIEWLQVLQENITLLEPDLERFVWEILRIPWVTQEKPVVVAFRHFLANLMSAHSFYTKPIMWILVQHFVGKTNSDVNDEVAVAETIAFNNVHETIQLMLEISPLAAKQMLLQCASECMPYMLTPEEHAHTTFVENLTRVLQYLASADDRVTILKILVGRLVQLDAYLPKLGEEEEDSEDEEDQIVFQMDDKKARKKLGDSIIARRNLDKAMVVMFQFIKKSSEDVGGPRGVYKDLLCVFETHIMPTYKTGHIQFLLFFLLNLDRSGSLTGHFLDFLWSKFCNPNSHGILRQSTVLYIASLLTRAKYVDIALAKQCLEKLVSWIHAYIASRDNVNTQDFIFTDLKAHGPFYAACQSAFYIFAFRHKEFVETKSNLAFLRRLNLATIVTCPLNPLRVCMPPVVQNFSAIARHYQLVYCDTIIERNNRINLPVVGNLSAGDQSGTPLLLDSFFPFDPYLLKESGAFLSDMYRVYDGAMVQDAESEDESEDDEIEDDDMMGELESKKIQGNIQSFLYGTSPGFKCLNE